MRDIIIPDFSLVPQIALIKSILTKQSKLVSKWNSLWIYLWNFKKQLSVSFETKNGFNWHSIQPDRILRIQSLSHRFNYLLIPFVPFKKRSERASGRGGRESIYTTLTWVSVVSSQQRRKRKHLYVLSLAVSHSLVSRPPQVGDAQLNFKWDRR